MKICHLSKSSRNGEYFLDGRAFDVNRQYLGEENVFKQVGKLVDKKRKTNLIIIQDGFPDDIYQKVDDFFKGTKVNVTLEAMCNLR